MHLQINERRSRKPSEIPCWRINFLSKLTTVKEKPLGLFIFAIAQLISLCWHILQWFYCMRIESWLFFGRKKYVRYHRIWWWRKHSHSIRSIVPNDQRPPAANATNLTTYWSQKKKKKNQTREDRIQQWTSNFFFHLSPCWRRKRRSNRRENRLRRFLGAFFVCIVRFAYSYFILFKIYISVAQ